MFQDNKAVIERLMSAFNLGNFSILDEIVRGEFVGHLPLLSDDLHGPNGLRIFYTALKLAIPDAQYPSWIIIAEDELVVVHHALEGTFSNEFVHIPPNGRKITVWMANIWRLLDGRIVEAWFNMDTLGLLEQMGLVFERRLFQKITENHSNPKNA